MEEIDIRKYIVDRKKEFSKLEEEISFLESIDFPVNIEIGYKGIRLISNDYTLATNFKIEKRDNLRSSSSNYDGGIHTRTYEFYPQFFFNINRHGKNFPVLIQHKGFDKDENIVIKSYDVTQGTGIYHDESRNKENYVDIHNTLSFFKKAGVEKTLIDKLQRKIEQRYNWVIT